MFWIEKPEMRGRIVDSVNSVIYNRFIENNIFNEISIEELAFVCNKSLSSFKRLFNAHFNDTPARYIKRRRLEHAAQLLSTTTENISSIAYDCCFNDPTTFSAVFSNYFGISPTMYRNQNRKHLTETSK